MISKVASIKPKEERELEGSTLHPKRAKTTETRQIPVISPKNQIPHIQAPSLDRFFQDYMLKERPVIIEGAIDHWPALNEHDWSDLSYLKKCAGHRTVPVEVGKHYLDKDWTQKLITLEKFIDDFVHPDEADPNKGYLAQTQLFEQIPELKKDIAVPMYCALTLRDDEECTEPIINAWFGPMGTVSPLHNDPYHNIFSQIIGSKYIRIYDPQYSEQVYPHQDKMTQNSSQVDVEGNLDEISKKFPKFPETPYLECIISRGQILYIPPKWWHYVRSLSVSFSVSFWWD
eukprot:TRINITY_DN8814_c0_g1_i1.p1 TRINITY_DN8814_c0_g1~~TRINITY_DN8814_c0_g1_i1.p1  ORF type:complete len:287 (-),score=76.12 TRINITY_DN8814_c0_g1_i1:126-986(-)